MFNKVILYRKDDSVIISVPSSKYQSEDMWAKCKGSSVYGNLERVDMNSSEMPAFEDIEQMYFDGDTKKENLKVDSTWSVKVMPKYLIRKKHKERLENKISEELAKNNADALKLFKLKKEKDDCIDWDDKKWHQQAIVNMQEDNINKPIVLQKLQDKINAN